MPLAPCSNCALPNQLPTRRAVAAMQQLVMEKKAEAAAPPPGPTPPKADPKPAAPSAPSAPAAPELTKKEAKAEAAAAAAVEAEELEDEAEKKRVWDILAKEDARQHMNVVFIGHVDAGKSTLGGQILVTMGGVDERTMEKYKETAKENNRESWYMAYVMDTNDEERAKGKTVEVGRAHFQTEKKRYAPLPPPF